MTNKILAVLIFLFFFCEKGYSQPFSQRFHFNYSLCIPSGGQKHNDHFYVLSYVGDTTCGSYYAPVIAKFDLNGSLVSTTNFCIPDTVQQLLPNSNALVFLSNGNILFHILFNGGGKSLLYICDSNLNVIQYKIFEDTNLLNYPIFDITEHNNAFYVLTADQPSNNELGIGIVKYDLNGNYIWRRNYDEINVTDFPSIIRSSPDGNLLIGASKSNMFQRPTWVDEIRHTHLFKIDTAGTVIDSWVDPDPNTYEPKEILFTTDNKIIYAGAYIKGQYWTDIYATGYIHQLDWSTGTKDWEVFKGDSSFMTSYNDLDFTGDGIIASGAHLSVDSGTIYGVLTEIDFNGNTNWHRMYRGLYIPEGNDNLFFESAVLDDGSIISCGESNDMLGFSGDPVHDQGWLTKVDSTGQGITNYSMAIPDEYVYVSGNIKVYPNPTTGILFLEGTNMFPQFYNIFSADGKYAISVFATNSIDVGSLASGIYFITNSNQTWFKKFVKQ